MKHIIKEELNYMKYLFGYQRGKVISEQTTPVKLNPDGCQKGYYRDCNTKQCTQIPANTKIAYTQQEYDSIKKTFENVTKFNQDYEKQVNESQLFDWNYYLKSNRTELYYKNHKKYTSPKYYTYTDFNDFKRKINKGEKYPKIPNIPQNKAVIDWINKSPSDEKKLFNEYDLLPRWQTYKHLFNSLKEALAYVPFDSGTQTLIFPDNVITIKNLGKEVYLDDWLKTKQGKLLSNLIDKVYVSDTNEAITDLHLHFKTPPTLILACNETEPTPVVTPVPSQPIPPPQPTPVPTPIPSQSIVQPPTTQTEPTDDNYPSYQPHLPKRSIGYDPVGKTISPFDNLQKSDKQYGRGKFHSRRTKSDGFYTKLSKRMKDAEKYYNGYYDDNGDYVEGEIEKAERNKRRIKFLEPLTKEDKLRQEIYNNEYNEYLKTKNLTSIK